MDDDTMTSTGRYELAYHLKPGGDDAELQSQANEVQEIISSLGGKITLSTGPKRIRLSYPINHNKYAYFSVLNFDTTKNTLVELDNHLKLSNHVLRYLIMRLDMPLDQLRTLENTKHRKITATKEDNKPELSPEEESKKQAAMDKQIEGVLEDITS